MEEPAYLMIARKSAWVARSYLLHRHNGVEEEQVRRRLCHAEWNLRNIHLPPLRLGRLNRCRIISSKRVLNFHPAVRVVEHHLARRASGNAQIEWTEHQLNDALDSYIQGGYLLFTLIVMFHCLPNFKISQLQIWQKWHGAFALTW